jgi:hypothetical protein
VTEPDKFPRGRKKNSRTRAGKDNRSFAVEQWNVGFCAERYQIVGSNRRFWGKLLGFQQFDKVSPHDIRVFG